MSGDPEHENFPDGKVGRQHHRAVAQFTFLFVIVRNSSFTKASLSVQPSKRRYCNSFYLPCLSIFSSANPSGVIKCNASRATEIRIGVCVMTSPSTATYCCGTVSIVSSGTLMTSRSEGPKGTPNAIRAHFFANAHLDDPFRMRMTTLPSYGVASRATKTPP